MAPHTLHEYKHEPTSNLDSVDTPGLIKDNFAQLVKDLSQVLGPSSGLTCADVSVDELKALMEKYVSKQEEWDMYNFKDQSRGYTRNLVDRGNGKSNLLILVWTPGKGSPIHDHANAHCLMKVLKGSLKEVRYAWPETGVAERGPPTVIKETLYTENQVTYMSDDLGIHRICNPDREEAAVSLHLYTPPNAARYGCHIFDERTGKQSRVSQCQFFSELGRRLE